MTMGKSGETSKIFLIYFDLVGVHNNGAWEKNIDEMKKVFLHLLKNQKLCRFPFFSFPFSHMGILTVGKP